MDSRDASPNLRHSESIPWTRYWVNRDSLHQVELDEAFLEFPSELKRQYSPSSANLLKTLTALENTPCLVLLGSSGMGKSHELRQLNEALEDSEGHPRCYLDLKGRSSSASLSNAITFQPSFRDWSNGLNELTLILDSLDECQRRIHDVVNIICEAIHPFLNGNSCQLRLRLGCRSAEWNNDAERNLRDLFPTDKDAPESLQVFHLERLTRDQVRRAAEHHSIDPGVFLADVSRLGIGALAAHPITLRMLLTEIEAGRSLGQTRTEIYNRGLLSLATDQHQESHTAPRNNTTPSQRLSLAARIAAIGALSDHYIFNTDSERPSRDQRSIHIEDLLGIVRESPPIDSSLPTLRETFWSGLFTATASGTSAWSHRSFGEYLAARHLAENLSTNNLVGLFCDSTTSIRRIYPQLEEIACWLAEFCPDFFDSLAEANAEVFLRCDPHLLQPDIRRRLADAYLLRVEKSEAEAPGWLNSLPLDRLNHATLGEQLRPFIESTVGPPTGRRAALEIAVACQCQDLAPICATLLLDPNTSTELISPVGQLLKDTADAQIQTELKSHLSTLDSPSHQVIAFMIEILWPEFMTAEELVRLLPPASEWERHDSLEHVCSYHIPVHSKVDQLPVLLRWIHQQGGSLEKEFHGRLMRQSIALLGLKHIEDPLVCKEFISLIIDQEPSVNDLLGKEGRNDDDETPSRRFLCKKIIEEYPSIPAADFRSQLGRNRLLRSIDLPWIVSEIRVTTSDELRNRWMNYAFDVFDGSLAAVEVLEPALELVSGAQATLASRTSWPLEESGRQNLHKTDYYRDKKREKKDAEKPSFETNISHALSVFEDGNLQAMPWLLSHLGARWPQAPKGTEDKYKENCEGWSLIGAPLTNHIDQAMSRYLERVTDESALLDADSNETDHTLHAFECLFRVWSKDAHWVETRTAEFWITWQKPVLFMGNRSVPISEKRLTELVGYLHHASPAGFADALDEAMLKHRKNWFGFEMIQHPSVSADSSVHEILFRHAQHDETASGLAHALWQFLLKIPVKEAETYLISKIQESPPQPLALAVLLIHRTGEHGASIAEFMIADPVLLRTVCLALPGNGFDVRSDWILRLPLDLSLRIWEVLKDIGPEDPYSDDDDHVTDGKVLYHLRNGIFNLFSSSPSPKACEALLGLQLRRPEYAGWIGQMLVRMRKALRSSDWIPLEPRRIRDYLDAQSTPRPISTEGDLCDRVIEILRRFQRSIRDVSNPSNELWNTPVGAINHWYPKDENEVSNRLQFHLNIGLAECGGKAVREAETRRGNSRSGDPSDIPDLLVLAPSATQPDRNLEVAIEVKCSWHSEAINAMRTQLTERYLRTFRCGVFCLVHFTCPTWSLPEDGRKNRPNARRSIQELEHDLSEIRDTLRTENPWKRIDAVLLDATRDIQ